MIYAKKIKAEYTISPFDTYEEAFSCAIDGNKDFHSWTSFEYNNIKEVLDDGSIFEFLENTKDIEEIKSYFDDQFSILHDLKEDEAWTLRQKIIDYGSHSYNLTLCEILTIITGSQWGWRIIRGSVQREWNNFYYDTSIWSDEDIRRLEIEYFNLGTEYECSYHEDMRNSDWIYCHGTNWEEDKKEILENFTLEETLDDLTPDTDIILLEDLQ